MMVGVWLGCCVAFNVSTTFLLLLIREVFGPQSVFFALHCFTNMVFSIKRILSALNFVVLWSWYCAQGEFFFLLLCVIPTNESGWGWGFLRSTGQNSMGGRVAFLGLCGMSTFLGRTCARVG